MNAVCSPAAIAVFVKGIAVCAVGIGIVYAVIKMTVKVIKSYTESQGCLKKSEQYVVARLKCLIYRVIDTWL